MQRKGSKRQKDFTAAASLFHLFHGHFLGVATLARGFILAVGDARRGRNSARRALSSRGITMTRLERALSRREPNASLTDQGGCTIYGFPAADPRQRTEAPGRRGMASVSSKATIMIVDDEPDVREVLEEYLASQGYAVVGAESASAARAAAAQQPIDLVARGHPHARRGRPQPRAAPARALREDRDHHADVRRHRRGPDRWPRDGRRRLRAQAVRPARARRAREERAAPHVGREPRPSSATSGCASAAACSISPRTGSRTRKARTSRCRRSSSTC